VLSARDGSVLVLTPPPTQDASAGAGQVLALSPSGRYAFRVVGGEADVIDMNTNTIAFRHNLPAADAQTAREVYSLLTEDSDGQIQLVGIRQPINRCIEVGRCTVDVIAWSSRSNAVRSVPVSPTLPYAPITAYGEHQVLVMLAPAPPHETAASQTPSVRTYDSVEAWRNAQRSASPDPAAAAASSNNPQRFAIVDIETMRITWMGLRSEAPAPSGGPSCTATIPVYGAYRGADLNGDLRFGANGEAATLLKPQRQAGTACEVSGDGAHLLVLAPPFAHLYSIDATARH